EGNGVGVRAVGGGWGFGSVAARLRFGGDGGRGGAGVAEDFPQAAFHRCDAVFVDGQVGFLLLLPELEVGGALFDFLGVQLRAAAGAFGEAVLEGADPVEGAAVGVGVGEVAGSGGVAEVGEGGHDVVEAFAGGDLEVVRFAFGDVAEVGAGEAVGLLFQHQRGVVGAGGAGLVLHDVPHFVGEDADGGHGAEGVGEGGQEFSAVPGDGVLGGAVEGVGRAGGGVPAQVDAAAGGVVGDESADRVELLAEGFREGGPPEGGGVGDRGAGEAVRWAVVGAFHGQPGVGGVGVRPAGAGGHREARHFVRGLGAGGGGGGADGVGAAGEQGGAGEQGNSGECGSGRCSRRHCLCPHLAGAGAGCCRVR